MSIKVKFFAQLREDIGIDECELAYAQEMTVASVWHSLTTDLPPEFLLSAVNFEYVDFDTPLNDGDEVAFFPPVTGG